MKKDEYKTPRITKFYIELYGWIFVICLFGSIWIGEYRWQLFFTSVVCIIFAIVLTMIETEKEKKFNIEKPLNVKKKNGN